MKYQLISQIDVPKGRDGKHKRIVMQLLSDIEQLETGRALKISLEALPDTKENIRSALNRATRQRGIELATLATPIFFTFGRQRARPDAPLSSLGLNSLHTHYEFRSHGQMALGCAFFKTRALAAKACDIGRIRSNEVEAKPARDVRVGDMLRIRNEGGEFQRRGSAFERDARSGYGGTDPLPRDRGQQGTAAKGSCGAQGHAGIRAAAGASPLQA